MNLLSRSLTAAVLTLAVLAPVATAATVTVRVEGASKTLVPSTKVTIPDSGDIPGADSECDWNEESGALEAATQGNWDRRSYVQSIMGEAYSNSDDKFWSAYSGGKYSNGICFTQIADGAEVLFIATRNTGAPNYNPTDLPLYLRDVPARAERGKPFSVRVEKLQPTPAPEGYYQGGTGEFVAAEDVVVQIGSATATTGADGRATITVNDTGQLSAQARTADNGAGRSAPAPVCVSCDPAQPVAGETAAPAGPACVTNGTDGLCGSVDRQSPQSLITGVREGQTFAAGNGPRELSGRIGVVPAFGQRAVAPQALRPDPSGLLAVKLRLTRNDRGRCTTWSGSRERFVRRPCGAARGWWFRIGDKADWSYLLPSKLPRGRYVLDVNAIDKAYNRDDKRRRGENRVVFRVR